MKPFIRTPYNYDRRAEEHDARLYCKDPSLTDQSFAAEVDINTIVDRFGISGTLPLVVRPPQYGDYTGVFNFQTAMNAVRSAQENFMELPAKLRARFHNDPQELLQFVADAENYDEAVKLGIVPKKPETPAPAPVAEPQQPVKTAAPGGEKTTQ